MAKTEVPEPIPAATSRHAKELKKELQRLVSAVLDEEDCSLETIIEVFKILNALKDLKLKKSEIVPDEFKCPISKELMLDPVILATGQTYDRSYILRWLNEGNRICPQTQQVLSQTELTPNHLVREMILHWCKDRGIELPKPVQDVDDNVLTVADRDYLDLLLGKISSSSLSDKKEAAKELRHLTRMVPTFRALFSDHTDDIPKLLNQLSPGRAQTDPDLQEDLIATILNISIHDENKVIVAENPHVIPLLIESLNAGTMETRSNAAAALFTLSSINSNKHLIGESDGVFKALTDLLKEGDQLAMMDAAAAIYNLCLVLNNKGRAVRAGVIEVVFEKIKDGILVNELLALLALLATHHKAVQELGELGVVSVLLNIIKDTTYERNKENCAAILYTICWTDKNKLKEIEEKEDSIRILSELAENGNSRAKRKAKSILNRLGKTISLVNTA